jgi:SAM-dependent methyltransferase
LLAENQLWIKQETIMLRQLKSKVKPFVPEFVMELLRPPDRLRRKCLLKYFMSLKRTTYQPIEIAGRRISGQRDWEDRWTAIKSELVRFDAKNMLDIGCGEGWFPRRAAKELGCFALGIDSDSKRIIPSEVARLHDDVHRVAVVQAKLQSHDIYDLPQFDVVLCLSVVHHVIRFNNIEEGKKFTRAVISRARKALIFEMGTSDETEMWWANDLPEMPDGHALFIERFLSDCGLINIRQIAWTPSYKRDTMRCLFVGEPGNVVG